MKKFLFLFLLFFVFFCGFFPLTGQSSSNPIIEFLECRNLALSEVALLFSSQTGLNVVPSIEASKVNITVSLQNLSSEDAISLLCKTHGLWYKKEPSNGAHRIHTLKEYRRDLASLQEEKLEFLPFSTPNVFDVAQAIRDLYGNRVQLSFGNDGEENIQDLENRFERFDLIEERSEGLGNFQSNQQNNSSLNRLNQNRTSSRFQNSNTFNRNNFSSTNGFQGNQPRRIAQPEIYEGLTPEEILTLEDQLEGRSTNQEVVRNLLSRRQAPIYLTVVRETNRMGVRTSDEKALNQIEKIVQTFDIPTSMVLLEVKILQVTLGDGFDSVFDFFFQKDFYAGGFTEGEIAPPTPGTFQPNGTGLQSDNLLFQYVSGSFAARLQLLENKNRVTTLATPLLLTANQEVSRIFVGDTRPIVTGFSEPETLATDNNVVLVPGSPITERQDIGTALLITPNINADRTVTLQILQETSEVNENGARIPVANSDGSLSDQSIDSVRRRSITGTIIAKDGLVIAIGGLIEESTAEEIEKTPILGEIPLLGMLFRRESRSKERRELVILVRPFVLTTVPEAEQASQKLLDELSSHPTSRTKQGTLDTYQPEDVLRGDRPKSDLHRLFNFHSNGNQEK